MIGNNATFKNKVAVADRTLVGAGAYITRDTRPEEVLVPPRSYALRDKSSADFYG